MFGKAQAYAKFIVAMIGAVVTTGTTVIPVEWSPYLTALTALLTAFAVYSVPNETAVGTTTNTDRGYGTYN